MKTLIIMACLLLSLFVKAQQLFTEAEFIASVKKFHPIAKSAALNVNAAKADVLAARGSFDPSATLYNSGKNFEGADYYKQSQLQLAIPAWYGIDIHAGTENIKGSRVSTEETTGNVSYIGFSASAQNILLDKRRATLQKAKLMVNAAVAERNAALNNLIYEAQQAYWNWWEQHHTYILIDSSLRNAQQRFLLVKTAYRLGDRPAIDTIEAMTQVQMFSLQKTQAYTELQKSIIEINAFLWKDNNEVYQLPEATVPQQIAAKQNILLDEFLNSTANHPELLQYRYKLNALRIEKRLAFQSFFPNVKFKYNQLQKGTNIIKPLGGAWFQNDNRFGVSLAIPLRLSEARATYRKAKIMIDQTALEQLNKQVQIETKIKKLYMEWQQAANLVQMQEQLMNSYISLQRGEEIRFSSGESSLFLINVREQKTFEAKQKLIELKSKQQRAAAGVRWAAATGL